MSDSANAKSGVEKSFTNLFSAEQFVAEYLTPEIDLQIAREMAQQFAMYCDGTYTAEDWPLDVALSEGETVFGAPFDFFEGSWTIREKELKDFKALALAVLSLFSHNEPRYSIAFFVMSVACMSWHLERKGVVVGPLERAVLITLRKAGPLTAEDLVGHLNANATSVSWTLPETLEALNGLGAITLSDGTVESLVHRAADGRWSTDARGLWRAPRGGFV